MKALITGAAGFVGPYLARALEALNGCEVVVTTLTNEKFFCDGIRREYMDILCPEEIEKLLSKERPDYIFHLAAQSSVYLSWRNPCLTVDVNIKGVINLLESIRREANYYPKILLIGSAEEYGVVSDDGGEVTENHALNPQNIYAVTKACQNMIGTLYAKSYGMRVVMARAFNHYGPGQSPQFVVADFCKQIAEIESNDSKEAIICVGNLGAKRDFTDVRDIVRAYIALALFGREGETYNVGSGRSIAIQSFLDELLLLSNKDIMVKVDPNKFRPIDVPVIKANTAKIFKDTGWKPIIPTRTTLLDTLDYWRERVKT
ncbi:MAG: GDP-mannose 4,6-dehydratase [Oscillospiraceae bacterium]|nr:GDP-mannose 4,6-dehydratase [Oscillospiraceae bacterium]